MSIGSSSGSGTRLASGSWQAALLRWNSRLWWLIAPCMVTLAAMHVWAHTYTRYATGEIPLPFGIYLGHGDIVAALSIWLLVVVSAAWLVGGVLLAAFLLLRQHRLPRVMMWQGAILFVALGIPFLPVYVWDEMLFATVGPGKTGGQLLANAASRGDIAKLRKLLDSGIAVDALNYARTTELNALGEAARTRQTAAVALLLERGADPNRNGFYERPLAYAALAGNVTMVRLLVEHGADPCVTVVRYNGNNRSETSLQALVRDDVSAVLPACRASAPGN